MIMSENDKNENDECTNDLEDITPVHLEFENTNEDDEDISKDD